MANIKLYKGREIDTNEIQKIKDIARKRYSASIYDEYFSGIKNIDDLSYLHNTRVAAERLVIGSDWFLCYSETDCYVSILEWVSNNNGNGSIQAIEMMDVLKALLICNNDKTFVADMRHDTSYRLYSKMLQKGYFKEVNHEVIIDCAAPPDVNKIKTEYMDRLDSIEEFLSGEESNQYSVYFQYILHHLYFEVNDKFINKYCHNTETKIAKKLNKSFNN